MSEGEGMDPAIEDRLHFKNIDGRKIPGTQTYEIWRDIVYDE